MIEKTHSSQSPLIIKLLNHVAAMGQCTAGHVHAMFLPDEASRDQRKSMVNQLSYLVETGQLLRQGIGKKAVLQIGPHAGAPGVRARKKANAAAPDAPPPTCQSPGAAAYRPQVAHAPNYNHMAADEYMPPPGPALRRGALQYQSCASKGCRC